ncbi:hypothetical protein S83_011468 [Arachis hypogaea]|nr:Tyrosine/DOPA decarboxylase [Arachis hypogaea]
MGKMLRTGLNIVGFNWLSSTAATELVSTRAWLRTQATKKISLPGSRGSMTLGTTCEEILATLVAARDRMLNQI